MAALLATVAVLQYRWTNEASSAEEMRMGAELESLMTKWHGDLYSEFSAICIAMQVGPDSGARDSWNDYLERYVEWNYALPHQSIPYVYRNPDLVGEIYIWETGRQAKPRLFWLSLDKKKIEASDVPPGLVNLLPRLEASSANLPMAMGAWHLPGPSVAQRNQGEVSPNTNPAGSNPIAGWQFDERAPAIVHPIFHREPGKPLSIQNPVDWIVITMDMSVLQKRVLPELSTRYFGGLDGLDYKIGVIATGPKPRTIYTSDSGFGDRDLAAADSTMNIFGPPLPVTEGQPKTHFRNRSSLRSSEWHSFYGPVWFPVIEYGSQPDPWVLELQHRAGPLQAVITQVRQKNLTMSAFVLLLLAVSIGVLTIAGFRAQKFARLQMDFVASVSHELRTPLTAILSAGENIKDGVVTEKSSLEHYGSMILSQARSLMSHVDRILLFASIRSGKDRYNLRPLEVSEILQCVRSSTLALISEESCIVEERIEPGLPRVSGDLFAVCGCLENLLTNAAKYSRKDRRICLSATLQQSDHNAQEVAISVEDHGIGIKGSELKQIFEPFYRSTDATAAQIHGTGLGLSLASHLAQAMGGNLTAVSEPGVGSIFTLHLLIAPEQKNEVSTLSLRKHKVIGHE
jgi:two-component system, OmpR family, sensor histidine kinase SenX3